MRAIISAILLLASTTWADTGLMRTWTASSGKKVQAEIVRIDGPSVILKTPKGEQISIRGASLSKHDIEYLDFYKDFRTENYDGTGPKIAMLKRDASIDKSIRFIKWNFDDAVLRGDIVFELMFYGEGHEAAYWLSPIPALNLATLKANIIDLKKEAKPQWFFCSRRSEIKQVEDNLYETTLWSEYPQYTDAYFSKKDFDAINNIPSSDMANKFGPALYYVYGRVGEQGRHDGLFLGELAQPAISNNVPAYSLSPSVRAELEKMDDSNWQNIRDKLLESE